MDKKKANEQVKFDESMERNFQIGDLAVYPAHGVGRIEAIEQRMINGETHDFYIMKILENNMVIMIPTWNVSAVGLRDIIDKEENSKCLRSHEEYGQRVHYRITNLEPPISGIHG